MRQPLPQPNAPKGTHPQLGPRELSSPNIFVARLIQTSSSYISSSTLKVIPSLPPVVSWAETSTSARSTHAQKISDLQFSLVIFNYNDCLCLAFQRLLSPLFIYSIIYLFTQLDYNTSLSNKYLPATESNRQRILARINEERCKLFKCHDMTGPHSQVVMLKIIIQ